MRQYLERIKRINDRPQVHISLAGIPTSWCSPNEFSRSVQRDRLESLRIIGTDRGADDKEQGFIRRCDSESPLSPN